MTGFYCKVLSFYWIIDYLIFLPIQFFFEIFFTIIVLKLEKKDNEKVKTKIMPTENLPLKEDRHDVEKKIDIECSSKTEANHKNPVESIQENKVLS